MEYTFFKDGEYEAVGGFFIRNDLKKFFQTLKEKGLNPVGITVDDESFNLEIIVEKNEAYIELYEKKQYIINKYGTNKQITKQISDR